MARVLSVFPHRKGNGLREVSVELHPAVYEECAQAWEAKVSLSAYTRLGQMGAGGG